MHVDACRSAMVTKMSLKEVHASSTVREVLMRSQETECKSLMKFGTEYLKVVEGFELSSTSGPTILTVKLPRTANKKYANEQQTPSDVYVHHMSFIHFARNPC